MSELSNYLKGNLRFTKEEKSIVDEFLASNMLTASSKNAIIDGEIEMVLECANSKFQNQEMYFIKDSKVPYWRDNQKLYDESAFSVLKVQNGQIEKVAVPKNFFPDDSCINKVFTKENNKYVYEKEASLYLQDALKYLTKLVGTKQDLYLDRQRREGHLYLVTEELGNSRCLWDLTDKPKNDFEEICIPNNILDIAKEGMVLKYSNGKYEFYSDDGFDRMVEMQ